MRTINKLIRRRIANLLIRLGLPYYALAVRGWAPIAGAAAPGQDPGGGEGAADGTGGDGGQEDPWGFQSHLTGADETIRPYLERVFGALGPQLQQRFDQAREPYQPLEPYRERLQPLLEQGEGGPVLDGLLEFYEMTGDPNRLDDFAQWWDTVGEEYGFFGDDEEGGDEGGEPGGEGGDPRDQQIADLQAQVQELSQGFETDRHQQQVDSLAGKMQSQLQTLMAQHGIAENEELPAAARPSTIILRIAAGYNGADNAIESAVNDYLAISGQSQAALVNGAGQATAPVSGDPLLDVAHTGGGRHGASLRGGSPDTEPEAVGGWEDARRIAMSRMQSAGQ
jgi:hypothetical protein